jgi:hypothetical protein
MVSRLAAKYGRDPWTQRHSDLLSRDRTDTIVDPDPDAGHRHRWDVTKDERDPIGPRSHKLNVALLVSLDELVVDGDLTRNVQVVHLTVQHQDLVHHRLKYRTRRRVPMLLDPALDKPGILQHLIDKTRPERVEDAVVE